MIGHIRVAVPYRSLTMVAPFVIHKRTLLIMFHHLDTISTRHRKLTKHNISVCTYNWQSDHSTVSHEIIIVSLIKMPFLVVYVHM